MLHMYILHTHALTCLCLDFFSRRSLARFKLCSIACRKNLEEPAEGAQSHWFKMFLAASSISGIRRIEVHIAGQTRKAAADRL